MGRMGYDSALHRVLMNVISMVREILRITNSMIGKSSLPDFGVTADDAAKFMRVRTLD